jgi:hypothetical protein
VASFKFGHHKSNVKSVERRGIKITEVTEQILEGGGGLGVFNIRRDQKGKRKLYRRSRFFLNF